MFDDDECDDREATFRLVSFADADRHAIAIVVNRAFATYPFIKGDRTSAADLELEAGPNAEFILAECEGELTGSIMLRPASEMPGVDEGRYGVDLSSALYLGLAAVRPLAMGAGIGRGLIERAVELARERGYQSVVFGTVREFNLEPFYERLGFHVATVEQYPAGHWNLTIDHTHSPMSRVL